MIMKPASISRKVILLRAGVLILLLTGFSASAQNQKLPQLGKSPVREVVKAMTTEEKAKLLVGMGFNINIPGASMMDPEDKRML